MTATTHSDARAFYERELPADFNRMLEEQRARGESGRAVYEGMRSVNATIRVEIACEPPLTLLLNIERGHMTASDSASHEPFLTVIQDERAVFRLARQAGGSMNALLGALAGLGGVMNLTRKRMIEMEKVDGLIRFEVLGDDGFSVLTHFGSGLRPEVPDASIRLSAEAYAELRAGRLEPQEAFLSGRIDVEGDMQKVLQLAYAAVAPD